MSNTEPTPQSRLKVINLFGPPGVGKSAARSGIFWLMKAYHLSVEEVSEYAKYLVLTGQTWRLKEEQLNLFTEQLHKQLITQRNGYEYAVTDSPLQLCSFYAPKSYFKNFPILIDEVHESFDNLNFFLTRDMSEDAQFEERGRAHDRNQSIETEYKMREFLDSKNIPYINIEMKSPVDLSIPWQVMEHVCPGMMKMPVFPT